MSQTLETPVIATPVAETAPASIQIEDIQNALNIIDYACTKGAFCGWDVIVQVQTNRNRLAAFLNEAKIAADNAQAETQSTPVDNSTLAVG